MCPLTHAHYFVLGLAVIASFFFGFLWYGPIFGKLWAELMALKMEKCHKPKPSAFALTFFGTVLTTFVLAYFLNIYKPYCTYGAAFFIWLGFYIPLLFSSVTWEGRPWKLFALNAAYYFLNLQFITAVLTLGRS